MGLSFTALESLDLGVVSAFDRRFDAGEGVPEAMVMTLGRLVGRYNMLGIP